MSKAKIGGDRRNLIKNFENEKNFAFRLNFIMNALRERRTFFPLAV